MLKELKGEEAIMMDEELTNKKMIATTRMFGNAVTDLNDIKEAVATYTARAAEKLRRQKSAASIVSTFVVAKEPRKAGEKKIFWLQVRYRDRYQNTSAHHHR